MLKTGVNDATTAIQNAINAAQNAGGGVVYLPTGTYKLNPGTRTSCLLINRSNIVLKGDGVGKTFLLNTSYEMNNKAIISVSGSSSSSWTSIPASKAMLTNDVMNPVSTLSVDNPSLFQVGDLVVVRNSITDAWITEHKEDAWLGGGSSLRGIMFCRYITAVDVNNKTISIDVPVRYALKTRDASCVFKLNGMISEVGLQDFSIANVQHPGNTGWGEEDYKTNTNSSFDCAGSYVIKFNTVVNSWMNNIETYRPTGNTTQAHMLSNGILVQFSKGVTIDKCNMSYAQYGGGGGNGYSFRVSANEVLISNSVASYVRHGFVFSSMWCSGNVFHKCRDIKNGFQTGNTGSMTTSGWGSDHHMHFSQSNLIDQCYSENSAYVAFYRPYGSVPKHNLTSTHTAFWNISSAGSSSGGSRGYSVWTQQSRYGYAIGTSGSVATIRTNENSTGSAAKTDPVDISEGQGLGASLIPQSLYKDQLLKRIAPISCETVIASADDGNVPENVLDEDFNTRWSAEGDGQYIEFCFDDTITVYGTHIAFFRGDERSNYFSIDYSINGINWLNILANQSSSGSSLDYEYFSFPSSIEAWKLRIIGHGNSMNNWNSITEVDFQLEDLITTKDKISSANKLHLYPNPASDYININSRAISASAVNVLGFQTGLPVNGSQVNVSSLSPGLYQITVVTETGVTTKSIIIQ